MVTNGNQDSLLLCLSYYIYTGLQHYVNIVYMYVSEYYYRMVTHSNPIFLPSVILDITIVSTKFQVYTLKPSQVTTY